MKANGHIKFKRPGIKRYKKFFEVILSKDISNKRYFICLLEMWFRSKGISFDSSQKIIGSYMKMNNEHENNIA